MTSIQKIAVTTTIPCEETDFNRRKGIDLTLIHSRLPSVSLHWRSTEQWVSDTEETQSKGGQLNETYCVRGTKRTLILVSLYGSPLVVYSQFLGAVYCGAPSTNARISSGKIQNVVQ